MKKFRKPEILEMAESDIFCVKLGADYDAVIENCLRPLFVEYEAYPYILAQKMISKMRSKYPWLIHFLESRCDPTATVTSLKLTWNERPDQAVKGKRLSPRNYSAYASYLQIS